MPEEADELNEYLRGGSALSREYQREPVPPTPHTLDKLVLDSARAQALRPEQMKPRPHKSQSLAPLAFAASVLLSVALVFAIVFGPQAARRADETPRVVPVRIYQTERPRAALSPRERNPMVWLEDISALRRAGRDSEADIEMRRFRSVYPNYSIPLSE
jgi:negative regulator of sigma E activity